MVHLSNSLFTIYLHLLLAAGPPSCLSFTIVSTRSRELGRPTRTPSSPSSFLSLKQHGEIVDAEFERVGDNGKDGDQENFDQLDDSTSTSLMDAYVAADPELKELRIPFVEGETSIDVNLGFMVELDGVSYAIGVPFDHCAAITIEKPDGTVENVSPDVEENVELMEIMAASLKEHLGDDLQLIRSPRVLTIAGPLDKYTKNWQEQILPKSLDVDTLLDDKDEDVEFFLDFMKKELGEEEFTKTMNQEYTFEDEFLSLFSAPGYGDRKDEIDNGLFDELEDFARAVKQGKDDDEIEELLREKQENEMKDVVGSLDDQEGSALKLVGYTMDKGTKKYSLVKLLKPMVLVAKQVEGPPMALSSTSDQKEPSPRFELLTQDEMRLVAPRLEEVCEADLERTGLNLQP